MLLGSLLLMATVVSFPLYKNAAFDRMLHDEFDKELETTGKWPAINSFVVSSKKDANGNIMNYMEGFTDRLYTELGIEKKENVKYYSVLKTNCVSLLDRGNEGNFELRPSMMSELEEHVHAISGNMFSESGVDSDGCIEVLINSATMVANNIIVGEKIELTNFKDVNNKPYVVKVVGVITPNDRTEYFWQVNLEGLTNVILIKEDVFRNMFCGERAGKYSISCSYYALFDYHNMTAADADRLLLMKNYIYDGCNYASSIVRNDYIKILESYKKKQTRIDTTLFILQIPVLILLSAFLIMISSQMYDMERNEISVIKSRGASGLQIFRLYLYQSVFLSLIGGAVGLVLGGYFCKLLGSADNFLQFNFERELNVVYTEETFKYALGAFIASVCIMTIPAIKHSKVTIVKLKQQKAAKKRSWWEICFLDIIFIGVAIYGYYNFNRNSEGLVDTVLKGEALDPLLYISSSLFILGFGMLILRLQPLIINGIYLIGKKWWGPASYASFMETIKNGRKQQFIMLFMILTISLGIFHATIARTILQNARENRDYLDGTDIIFQENWKDNSGLASLEGASEFRYYEPDITRFNRLSQIKKYTKVVYDKKANIKRSAREQINITVMGIHTKEFGEMTHLSDELLGQSYRGLLNELALSGNGVLISNNMKDELGYKIGDRVAYISKEGKTAESKIVGTFEYWPGYVPTEIYQNEEGNIIRSSNYLVVANIASLQQYWGVTPYQIWIELKDGENSDFFYDWIKDNKISAKSFSDKAVNMDNVTKDPLLQGTNGILTMSFIVTIILCVIGYLIYWIMSIRSREMIFGILRANGLHKGEIFIMLILEQIFLGVFSIVAGIGIGNAASKLYAPILQKAYVAADQVIPMKLITDSEDMIRLYGVTIAGMIVCLFILTMIVFKLNIAKALKLGEE